MARYASAASSTRPCWSGCCGTWRAGGHRMRGSTLMTANPQAGRTLPEITIDDILHHSLPSRDIRRHVAFFEHVLFQLLETDAPRLDALTDVAVPGAVTVLDEVAQDTVGADLRRDLEPV